MCYTKVNNVYCLLFKSVQTETSKMILSSYYCSFNWQCKCALKWKHNDTCKYILQNNTKYISSPQFITNIFKREEWTICIYNRCFPILRVFM